MGCVKINMKKVVLPCTWANSSKCSPITRFGVDPIINIIFPIRSKMCILHMRAVIGNPSAALWDGYLL